jgi:hypothetical protein
LNQVRLDSSPTCSQETKQSKTNNDIVEIEFNGPSDQDEEVLQQKGFKKSVFGYVMTASMAIISVFWIIILLVLCLDYYGYVSKHRYYTRCIN